MRILTAVAVAMSVTMRSTIHVHFQSASILDFRIEKPEFSMSEKRSIHDELMCYCCPYSQS